CSASALTTRPSRTRIPSLMRISFAAVAVAPCRCGLRSGRATHGEGGGTTSDLGHELGEDAVHRHRAEVLAGAATQARRAVLGFALSDHQHVGHLPELGVADAIAELLVAVVQLGAHARGAQPAEDAA